MAISFGGHSTSARPGATGTWTTALLDSGLMQGDGGGNYTAVAGDFLVILMVTGSNTDRSFSAPTGAGTTFTEQTQLYSNGSSYDTNLVVWTGFIVDPADDLVLPESGHAQDASAFIFFVFKGVDTGTPMDVAVQTATGTGTGRPDAPAITPTTAGAWIVTCLGSAAATGAIYTKPADLDSTTNRWISVERGDTHDAMAGMGLKTDWASGSFDPAAVSAGGTTNAGDSWAAATLVLRPDDGIDELLPSLFTNTNSFFAPTVSPGAVGLTPSLFTNTQTFHGPTLTSVYGLTPGLFTNTQTFHGPTVTSVYALTPSLFTNDNTFFSPTVAQGSQVLTASLFTNTNQFLFETGSNLVTNGTFDSDITGWSDPFSGSTLSWETGRLRVTRATAGYQIAYQAFTPVTGNYYLLSADYFNPDGLEVIATQTNGTFPYVPQSATQGRITSHPLFNPGGDDYLSLGINTGSGVNGDYVEFDNVTLYEAEGASISLGIAPSLFTNTQTFYDVTVSSSYGVSPSLVTNTQTFFSATVTATRELLPSLFTNTNAFYGPTAENDNTLIPSLVVNDNTFYAAVVDIVEPIQPPLFINTTVFFPATVYDPFRDRRGRALHQPLLPKGHRLRQRFGRR